MTSQFNLEQDGADVQAIVRSGFGRAQHCRYLLLKIQKPGQVSGWITRLLLAGLVRTVADENRSHSEETVVLAFSYAGLDALGLTELAAFPFPTAFRKGMADPTRMPLLGDRVRAWNWGDTAAGGFEEVHLLMAHYWTRATERLPAMLDVTKLEEFGLSVVRVVETCPYYLKAGTEPFGFRDGIAQPTVAELMDSKSFKKRDEAGGATFGDDVVALGEFLLGYTNEYGERSYCPDMSGWQTFASGSGRRFARNGSYLAVRQIEQDVAKFRSFARAEREKMIGRTEDGQPLVTEPGNLPNPEKHANDFRYRLADYEGFQCPRGAHIRRANPRDALGWDVPSGVKASKLHRLIRRGRVYTESDTCGPSCESDNATDGCGKGLFFIALNADIDRQFEFVQQRWCTNFKFGDLWDEADPALGDGPDRSFSMPGCVPVGTRLHNLPQFTTVKGGGYFFLPGLSALRFISEISSAASEFKSNVPPARTKVAPMRETVA